MDEESARHIIRYILLLRLKIAGRFLAELGWLRTGLLAVCLISFFIPFGYYENSRIVPVIFMIGISLTWSIHYRRRDGHFIRSLGLGASNLYCIEYLFTSSPFVGLLIWHCAWLWLGALLSGAFVLSRFPVHINSISSTKKRFRFPDWLAYEWTSGLRRQKWTLSVLMITAITALPFNILAGWLCLYFITAIIASFYQYCEPEEFILLFQSSPGRFLKTKILHGIGYFMLLTGILWIEALALYPHYTMYTVLFMAANVMLVGTVIVAKYAFFQSNVDISVLVSSIFFAATLFLIVPYLLPVLLGLLVCLTVRANKRLKTEVYVFD